VAIQPNGARLTIAFVIWLVTLAPPARGDDPSLNDLRVQLTDQLTSINSIECRYTVQQRPSEIECTWTWCEDGDRKSVISEPYTRPDGEYELRRWFSFDGDYGYNVAYDPESPDHILHIYKSAAVPWPYFGSPSPEKYTGRRLHGTNETLLTLLHREQAVILGRDAVDGHDCVHLDLGECQSGSHRYHWEAWLDPAFDHLPRRLYATLLVTDERTQQLSDLGYHHEKAVQEFRKVHDEFLDRERWFPVRMSSTSGLEGQTIDGVEFQSSVLSVLSIRINAPIPDDRFTPQPEFGTTIYDETVVPTRVTVHGGEAAVQAMRDATVQETRELAQRALEAPGPPVVAVRPDTSWGELLLRWGSIGLLCVATVCLIWQWLSR
jgi:hypothetical protein